jgi:hypothetical protein
LLILAWVRTVVATVLWEADMAIGLSGRTVAEVEQLIAELLEQRNDVEAQQQVLAEIRESVRQYEERYGMSSDCIHDAIDAGELIEDLDVCNWIFSYDLLQSVEAT